MNAAVQTRTNRYADTCAQCRKPVPANEGTLQGPPWRTICPACLPRPAVVVSTTVEVRLAGTAIAFHPAGYLGDRFARFRAALDGCRYNPGAKLNLADDPALAARAIARLIDAGFLVDVTPEVKALVDGAQATGTADRAAAEDRAVAVDAQLQARGLALYPFQKIGVSWLAPLGGALLGDDMGLGKTIQALTAAPAAAPVLVIGPAVAKGVWVREAGKWRPDLTADKLAGRTSFRWPKAGEMVVLNWDILPAVEDPGKIKARKPLSASHAQLVRTARTYQWQLGAKPGSWAVFSAGWQRLGAAIEIDLGMSPTWWKNWSTAWRKIGEQHHARDVLATCPPGCVVIADEAHVLKYSKTLRTQRFRALAKVARKAGGRAWLLTGTPLLNNPAELWAVLAAAGLEREAFGNWPTFMRIAGGSEGRFGIVWDGRMMDRAAMAERLQRVMLRRMKVDVLTELPAKTRRTIDVELSSAAAKLCDSALAAIDARGMTIEAALATAKSTATTTIGFESWSRARAALATAKLAAAIELVEAYEDAGEPVVVFSAHRAPIDALAKRPGWAAITGETHADDRTRIEEAFQRGELKGVAATIKAAGVAITLTRACEAIFIDLDPTPALNLQAEDRISRIGQTRGQIISQLVADHDLEARMHDLIVKKMTMIENSVDAAKRTATEVPADVAADLDAAAAALEAAQADIRAYVERLAQLDAEYKARLAEAARKAADKKQAAKVRKSMETRGVAPEGLGGGHGDRDRDDDVGLRRGPQGAVEEWAAAALVQLALDDGDHAYRENEVGFSKADVSIGHYLAGRVGGGMTEDEWRLAPAVCGKYWRQIGPRPGSELAREMGGGS